MAAAAAAPSSPSPDLQQHHGSSCSTAAAADVLRTASSSAVPAVFRGLNAGWRGLTAWADLQYLQQQAGAAPVQVRGACALGKGERGSAWGLDTCRRGGCTRRPWVQAMHSTSDIFTGAFEHHQEVSCTFGELLEQASQQSAPHLYLAQQPLQEGTGRRFAGNEGSLLALPLQLAHCTT
jgi:hypothetical protein